jgi:hypothetical protein
MRRAENVPLPTGQAAARPGVDEVAGPTGIGGGVPHIISVPNDDLLDAVVAPDRHVGARHQTSANEWQHGSFGDNYPE